MPTREDVLAALRKADAAGDTQAATRFATMLGGNATAADAAHAAGVEAGGANSPVMSAIQGAADTGTLGGSNYINAGARYLGQRLTGVDNPDDFSTDLAFARGQTEGSAAANPGSNLAGNIAGIPLGAGPISMGLKGAKAIAALRPIVNAVEMHPAQGARNILRAAGLGGAMGATQAANDTGEAGPTAAAGVAGAVLGPVASYVGGKLVKVLTPAGAKAGALLSKILGEDSATIDAARANFRHATATAANPEGTEMPMAALMTLKQQGALRDLAAANPDLGAALAATRDTVSAARPGRMADVLEHLTGAPQDVNTLATAVDNQMTGAMKPIRSQTVPVTDTDIEHLMDDDAYGALRRNSPLRDKLLGVQQDLRDNPGATNLDLTVSDIDNLRQAIRGRRAASANPANSAHNPHTAKELGDLMDSVTGIAGRHVPEYADALDNYAAGQRYIDSFEHGLGGKDIGDASKPSLRTALLTPEGALGHQAGVATRVSNAASATEQGATRVAADLTQPGTQFSLRDARLPARAMGRLGAAESGAASSLDAVAPRSVRPDDTGDPQTMLHAIAAATYHSKAGMLYHLSAALRGLKLSAATRDVLTRYLTDPAMTKQAYNILRKAGQTDDAIRRFATGLAVSTGSAAGNTVAAGGSQ